MVYLTKHVLLALCACFAFSVGNAQSDFKRTGDGYSLEPQSTEGAATSRAAACPPSTAIRDLEWNNVRALLETGGNMWEDRAVYRAAYEVPKKISKDIW